MKLNKSIKLADLLKEGGDPTANMTIEQKKS
jgi:hypothetical protein